MTAPWLTVLAGWAAVAAVMFVLWLVQRTSRNAGIVDVAWSLATAALGTWFALTAPGLPARRLTVAVMATVWGVRLGTHLFRRVRREEEDGRYRALRAAWGVHAERRLLAFFQLQALWAVLFAVPMLAAASNAGPWRPLDAAGTVLWLVAVAGEWAADRQLRDFRSDPRNGRRVCRRGLWRYSRHPNYFFEWLHWFAYVCLAAGSPLWWTTLAGVVTMFYFLTRVTGIPPTEAQAIRSRGDDYRLYQQTTNAFFPGPPRRLAP